MSPLTRRVLLITAMASIVGAGLAWSFWPRPVPVEMVQVSLGPMRVEVSDEGRTRVREIYQLSAPVAGRLRRIQVHAGDIVIGGKTRVAELNPVAPAFLDMRSYSQAESAVKSAEAARSLSAAELGRAKAELAFAGSELKRAASLAQSDAISKSDFERAQLAHDRAEAQVATAEAALRARNFELERAQAALIEPEKETDRSSRSGIVLRAPVSGRVLRVRQENEAAIPAGASILEIGDPEDIEIVAELVSEDAVKVREGAIARITDWGGTAALNARVRRIEPSGFTKISALGVEEQRVNVLLDFAEPMMRRKAITDGFRVFVHITVWQGSAVLRVPTSAMFRQGDGWAVFAVREGKAVLTPVRVGHSNDEVSEVLGGLTAGEFVIPHPSDRVSNGTRVAQSSH